ncbi:MAG: ABC transporter permease [Flavobacteriales bacterium]|nr:ABC transporter permease [Flavobacteriales bacterium]
MVKDQEHWNVVIDPRRPWWVVDLRELWRYRDLLKLLVRRDLLAVYKQTILGPAWQVVQPLLTSIMFAVVFGMMARLAEPGYPPLLFYMSGVVPWLFFASVLNRTAQTLVFNAQLMTKVYYPRLISPMATTLSASVSFFTQLATFSLFAVYFHLMGEFTMRFRPDAALLPLLIIVLMMIAGGLGLLVSALTTKFRDFTVLLGFGVQLLMFMSPVIFPLSRVPEGSTLRTVIELNPMTPVIEGFRAVLLGTPMDWGTMLYAVGFAVGSTVVGILIFQRAERSFADVV